MCLGKKLPAPTRLDITWKLFFEKKKSLNVIKRDSNEIERLEKEITKMASCNLKTFL